MNGMTTHNVMQFPPPAVNTICLRMATSMASYVLVGREYKKRVAFPPARIMINEPAGPFAFTDDDD